MVRRKYKQIWVGGWDPRPSTRGRTLITLGLAHTESPSLLSTFVCGSFGSRPRPPRWVWGLPCAGECRFLLRRNAAPPGIGLRLHTPRVTITTGSGCSTWLGTECTYLTTSTPPTHTHLHIHTHIHLHLPPPTHTHNI